MSKATSSTKLWIRLGGGCSSEGAVNFGISEETTTAVKRTGGEGTMTEGARGPRLSWSSWAASQAVWRVGM